MALVVKNLLVNAGDIETRVSSLGQEDPVEEKMAAHSSLLAWRIPWTEEPCGLQSTGSQKSDTTEAAEHACTRQVEYSLDVNHLQNYCLIWASLSSKTN